MEPLIRIRAKNPIPSPTSKETGDSPINSTASASWLLAALDGHRDTQPNEPATPKADSCPPIFTSALSILGNPTTSENITARDHQKLNLTKGSLSGHREVIEI